MTKNIKTLNLLIITFFNFFILNSINAEELKIYSERQPLLIEPLLNEFEKETGIKVEWIYSKKGLVQKIILENPTLFKENVVKGYLELVNKLKAGVGL